MGDGKDFERIVGRIFAILAERDDVTVRVDDQVPGADGTRQIDVSIRSRLGPLELLTVVECKDYNKVVDVTKIDAFQSVIADVGASKGVMVSRKGFSRTARQKAERVGIDLFRADNVSAIDRAVSEVPVHVRELSVDIAEIHLQVSNPLAAGEVTVEPDQMRQHLSQAIRSDLMGDPDALERVQGPFTIELGSDDLVFPGQLGPSMQLENGSLSFTLQARHYFGHLQDSEEALFLENVTSQRVDLLINADELALNYQSLFSEISGERDLPTQPLIIVRTLALPRAEDFADLRLQVWGQRGSPLT